MWPWSGTGWMDIRYFDPSQMIAREERKQMSNNRFGPGFPHVPLS
jgi:hypothetical protein